MRTITPYYNLIVYIYYSNSINDIMFFNIIIGFTPNNIGMVYIKDRSFISILESIYGFEDNSDRYADRDQMKLPMIFLGILSITLILLLMF